MKRIAMMSLILGLGIFLTPSSRLAAQSTQPASVTGDTTHVSVGVFGDYLRYHPLGSATGLAGVGARLGVNMSHHTAIEGEMDYDFARNYSVANNSSNGVSGSTTFTTVGIRPLWALFGPRFDLGTEHLNFFVTGKVGVVNWSNSNPNRVDQTTFSNAVNSIGGSGTQLALYPGGGIQGYWGFFGLRVEAGDAIYVNNGAHSNLRLTFGPQIRF